MGYAYRDDVAIADVAFEAWGEALAGLFESACDALTNTMVENLDSVRAKEARIVTLSNEAADMLLFSLLEELVYYKDADCLFLRPKTLAVEQRDGGYFCSCELKGERIDPERHVLLVDVKAVTLHRFEVKKSDSIWRAFVILDV